VLLFVFDVENTGGGYAAVIIACKKIQARGSVKD
jgi:hypothetical protein